MHNPLYSACPDQSRGELESIPALGKMHANAIQVNRANRETDNHSDSHSHLRAI